MTWWSPTDWDWLTSGVRTIIGAGIGTTFVQVGYAVYQERYRKRSHAAYMAMRLAVTLEAYAAASWDLIARNRTEEPHPEGRFTGNATLPLLSPYPEDVEGWRAIDRALAGRCLSLPLKVHANQVDIGWTGTFVEEDWDNVGELVEKMAADRGLDAWKLASALRSRHRIERADEGLNFSDRLTEVVNSAAQAQADQRDGNGGQRPTSNRRRRDIKDRPTAPTPSDA